MAYPIKLLSTQQFDQTFEKSKKEKKKKQKHIKKDLEIQTFGANENISNNSKKIQKQSF